MFRPLAAVPQTSLDANSQRISSGCDPTSARAYALSLLGSYRGNEVDDPRVYTVNAVAVLCRYPEAIVAEVCGPGVGIQTRSKWLPTVSELREACEHAVAERQARERRELLAKHRVLIDTPRGLAPEASPNPEKPSQEARARAVAYWEQVKAGFAGEQRKQVITRRLEELQGQPLPPLSEAAKASLGLGAYDRAPIPEAAE
jgi:hypothetical protein